MNDWFWLIDWLIDWSIDWLIDWLINWLIDWLIVWLIDWASCYLKSPLKLNEAEYVDFQYIWYLRNTVICKEEHDATAACRQGKVEQVHIESKCAYYILIQEFYFFSN